MESSSPFCRSFVNPARCTKAISSCRPGCTVRGYLQCALVLQHPRTRRRSGRALGDSCATCAPTVVLSPALGGLIIGHEVAPRARRARDFRRASGQRVDAAPRFFARRRTIASSSSRTSSRRADRRARRWWWRRPRARPSSARARSSIAAAASPGSTCRSSARYAQFADLRARELSALPSRGARHQAGLAQVDLGSLGFRGWGPPGTVRNPWNLGTFGPLTLHAHFETHAGLRRHELRRLAAADERAVDSAGGRGRVSAADRTGRAADGRGRGPDGRGRPRARPGRQRRRSRSITPPRPIHRALNVRLPTDVRVIGVVDAPPGFHAQFHATGKTYRYRISTIAGHVAVRSLVRVARAGTRGSGPHA